MARLNTKRELFFQSTPGHFSDETQLKRLTLNALITGHYAFEPLTPITAAHRPGPTDTPHPPPPPQIRSLPRLDRHADVVYFQARGVASIRRNLSSKTGRFNRRSLCNLRLHRRCTTLSLYSHRKSYLFSRPIYLLLLAFIADDYRVIVQVDLVLCQYIWGNLLTYLLT